MVPRKALCILPLDTTVDRIASSMLTRNISSVIIGNEKEDLLGLVTKTDLLDVCTCGKNIEDTIASEIMERDIHFCNEKDTIEQVSEEMIKHKVHHLLVRNEKNELVGLVSTYDVIRNIAFQAEETFPYLGRLFGIESKKQKKWREDVTFQFGEVEKEKIEPEKK